MTSTDELRRLLDERGVKYFHDDYGFHKETRWTFGSTGVAIYVEYEKSGNKHFSMVAENDYSPEQAIAATLGDDDYECRMDELLCRLTNGKWSKSRSHSVDFMVSCVNEAYDDATLESETCEIYRVGNTQDLRKCSACGGLMHFGHPLDRSHLNYCPNCGRKIIEP